MACFWKDYSNTVEDCGAPAVIVAGVSYVKGSWPQYDPGFPNTSEWDGTSQVTFFDNAYLMPLGERNDTLYGSSTVTPSQSAGQIDGTYPQGFPSGTEAPLDPTVNAAPNALVSLGIQLPSGTLNTFFESNEGEYSPDWIDFGIAFDGLLGTETIVTSVLQQIVSETTPSAPLTVTFTEDSTGQWRVRLTGLEAADIATGDGNSFTYADWATNGPFGGWRWAGVEVRFVIDGTPTDFILMFNWNFFSA